MKENMKSILSWLAIVVLDYLLISVLISMGIFNLYHIQIIETIGINVILAVGLNLIVGCSGQFSLDMQVSWLLALMQLLLSALKCQLM